MELNGRLMRIDTIRKCWILTLNRVNNEQALVSSPVPSVYWISVDIRELSLGFKLDMVNEVSQILTLSPPFCFSSDNSTWRKRW